MSINRTNKQMVFPAMGTQWIFSGGKRVQRNWGFSLGFLLHGKPYNMGFIRAISTSGGFSLVTGWAIMKPWSTAYQPKLFRAVIPTNRPILLCINLKLCTTEWQSFLLYIHAGMQTHMHAHIFLFLLTSRNTEDHLIISCSLLSKEMHIFIHGFHGQFQGGKSM